MDNWLQSLKVGDKVLVCRKRPDKTVVEKVVSRITPTGRIIVDGIRYESDGTVELGGVWNKTWLEPSI